MSSSNNEPRTPPSQRPPLQPVPNTESERPKFWLPTVVPGSCKRKLIWGPGPETPPLTRSAKRIKDLEEALAQKEKENESLKKVVDEQLEEIEQLSERTCWIVDELHEWIGRSLKCKFLMDKINEISPGDPKASTTEDLWGCLRDIEIPEVSDEVWKNSIPTRLKEWPEEKWEDDHMLGYGEEESEEEEEDEDLISVDDRRLEERSMRLLTIAAERENLQVCEECENIIEGDEQCEICAQAESITLSSVADSLDFGPTPNDESFTDLEIRFREIVEDPAAAVIQRCFRRYIRNRT